MRPPLPLALREGGERPAPLRGLSAEHDERAAAIYGNQFGTSCSRVLAVHNDLPDKGLGWLTRYWATAMLVAVHSKRVLHEVATPRLGNQSARWKPWCAMPPYTLECYFMRWNDCNESAVSVEDVPTLHRRRTESTWGVLGLNLAKYRARPLVHMLLSSFTFDRWPGLRWPRPQELLHLSVSGALTDTSANTTGETFATLRSEAIRFLYRPRS